MILSQDDLDFLAFDPPHLGIPGSPSHCGRAETQNRFVEIFLCVQGEKVTETGFLTSIPGQGMVCASLCCQALLGKTPDEVADFSSRDLLNCFPENMRTSSLLLETAELCIRAACSALAVAQKATDTCF